MQVIRYSRARLGAYLVLVLSLGWGAAWVWASASGKAAFAGALLTIVMVCVIPYALRYLALGNTIAEIGRTEIRFHGMLGTRRLRYDRLTEVTIETQRINWVFKQRFLVIGEGPGYFDKVRISESLLARDSRPLERIVEMMADEPADQREQVRPATRLGEPPVAHARSQGFGRKTV